MRMNTLETERTDSWILLAIFLMMVCNLIMAMLAD